MILAFDPGVTTGWASYDQKTRCYHIGHLGESLQGINRLITMVQPDVVLYEDFKHRAQLISSELYSLQVIGVLRLWLEENPREQWHCLPAEAKAFWSDDKIKAIGLWERGKKHAMDAMRVLLTYMMKTDKEWASAQLQSLRQSGL